MGGRVHLLVVLLVIIRVSLRVEQPRGWLWPLIHNPACKIGVQDSAAGSPLLLLNKTTHKKNVNEKTLAGGLKGALDAEEASSCTGMPCS